MNMPTMKTKAVRLYGVEDLRLEEFDLPQMKDDGKNSTFLR